MTRKLNRIREGTRSNWMISECLDSNNTTRDRKLQKNEAVSLELLGSLSKNVFERHTLTGSAFFSPLICLDAITRLNTKLNHATAFFVFMLSNFDNSKTTDAQLLR